MRTDRKIDVPFRTQQFILLAAQAGSFHRAAKALGINPSSIVRSVNRLERQLGVKIFDRSRQTFEVTNAAIPFIRGIAQAIEHVERACEQIQYRTQLERGPFSIGYSAYVHSRLIPVLETMDLASPERARFVSEIADSKLRLESGPTPLLVNRVQSGGLHAAFGITPITADRLSVHPISKEHFSLGVSKNHRLAKQQTVLARDLDREILFFLPRAAHPMLYDQTMDYIESTGARPRLREVTSFTHAMEIVTHNFGVALLPRSASRFSCMGVLFKPVADRLLSLETALFYSIDQHDPRLPVFIDRILDRVRQL